MRIFVNGRFRSHKVTGIQRYAHELTRRLNFPVCEPASKLRGWRGHAWEQTVLPARSLRGLLWSPCAAGPLISSNHIVTFHDLFTLDSPLWYRPSFARGYRVLLTALSRTATHIIAVSHFTKSRLVDRLRVDPARVTVIHNGVDCDRFHYSKELAARARYELSLPPGRYVLCLGSLEPRKNLRCLLSAWSEIAGELPADINLIVTGSRDTFVFNSLGITEVPNRVAFTGYVPDELLAGLYSGSLAFLYPSLGEGFGFPPLEAMACEVPTLTSNVTSLPEVCGPAAVYVDPSDVSDLARGIRRICTDSFLRARLSALSKERVAEFTWDRAARATSAVLVQFAS
jgi:glycosyltransferase involved in cell wall biosynthesis